MAYVKVGPWVNNNVPPISAANLDQVETQYDEAVTTANTNIATHSGLTTGVHGVGGSTVASVANIATHAGLFTLHNKIVRKTAAETVNNSAALQDDNELLMAIAANEVWVFEVILKMVSQANADFKFDFTTPVDAYCYFMIAGWDTALATFNQYSTAGTSLNIGGTAAYKIEVIKGLLINGANAGNLTLQWAQATAQVSNTIVDANSCLIAQRIA